MEITRFMNPNRKNVETKSFLPAGIRIRDIDQRVLNTEEKYIGIVDENGEMLGAIQVERLRFIYQWNIRIFHKLSQQFLCHVLRLRQFHFTGKWLLQHIFQIPHFPIITNIRNA